MNPAIFSKVFDLLPGWVWALLCAAALVFGWWQYDDKRDLAVELAQLNEALANQKAEAATKLGQANDLKNAAERALEELKREREKVDGTNQAVSAAMGAALGGLAAGTGGRLLDPNAARRWTSSCVTANRPTGPARDRAASAPEAPGLLSPELTQLLREEVARNDEVNDAYASCRAYVFEVEKQVKEYNERLRAMGQ